MISKYYQTIFIHIPKCAGSSIEEFFKVAPFDWKKRNMKNLTGYDGKRGIHLQHATASQLLDNNLISLSTWNKCFKFSFVRNPYTRTYSDYYWMMLDRKIEGSFEDYILKKGSFKEFLTNPYSSSYRGDHLTPQHKFIFNESEEILVDFVGKYENLQDDFNLVCDKIKVQRTLLPHAKKSDSTKKIPLSDFYTEKNKMLVQEAFEKDFLLLGYNINDLP